MPLPDFSGLLEGFKPVDDNGDRLRFGPTLATERRPSERSAPFPTVPVDLEGSKFLRLLACSIYR
ncbi:hypothetical protein [Pseudoxanthomonas winnipegensis]|uniref:hypothetical protein n=1 Tax=Pseudoxanthomonas winnipegensis TaxID=2480810 RepID=UPI003F836B50